MYKHSLKISSSLFLPIFGIPLHNRVNPIIVAKLGNFIDIDLSIDIYSEHSDYGVSVKGYRSRIFRNMMLNFVKALSEELNAGISISLVINYRKQLPILLPGSIYVLISSLIGKAIVGDELDRDDLAKALTVLDRRFMGRNDFIEAIRWAYLRDSNIAFRRFNEIIEISKEPLIRIIDSYGFYKIGESIYNIDDEIMDLLTKIIGVTAIYGVRYIKDRDDEDKFHRLLDLLNLHNRLWSLIYGLPVIKHNGIIYIYDGVAIGKFRFKFE